MKFKIGDRVRYAIKLFPENDEGVEIGDEGIVEYVGEENGPEYAYDKLTVDTLLDKYDNSYSIGFMEDELELIDEI